MKMSPMLVVNVVVGAILVVLIGSQFWPSAPSPPTPQPAVAPAPRPASAGPPQHVRDELVRLHGAHNEAIREVSALELKALQYETEQFVKNGATQAWAKQSSQEIYGELLRQRRLTRDDAQRRLRDFESQMRAQYGEAAQP